MDEISALADQIRRAIQGRNVRVLDAIFRSDPVATLDAENTSVDDLVAVIDASFTPFVSIIVTFLDTDEIGVAVELDGEGAPAPPEATRIVEEHAGEGDTLGVYWLHNGATLSYLAVASWRVELDAIIDEWLTGQRAQFYEDRSRASARITSLADRVAADPAFRAGNNTTRRAVGARLVDEMLAGDEEGISRRVLDEAMRQARDATTAAYLPLREGFEELAAELVETTMWRTSNARATDRADAARQFLLNKADGYGPTLDDVAKLRTAAEKRVGRR